MESLVAEITAEVAPKQPGQDFITALITAGHRMAQL